MPPKARHYHISDPGWRIRVRNYLRAGFGVEDIALKLRAAQITPNSERHVRDLVSEMRANGSLELLFRRESNARKT
jgi:hypothetical protein